MPAGRARFAPSPTGPLHLGNLRTALLCWLHARLHDHTLILRIEDVDTTRCRPVYTAQLLEDLEWLGLDWDEGPGIGGRGGPFVQSQRFQRYQQVLDELVADGRAYPCSCSRKEVRTAAVAAGWEPGQTLVYPGTCSARRAADVLAQCAERGRPPAWRLRVPPGLYAVDDEVAGPLGQDVAAEVGDPALARADGVYAYQLAVVVDDIDQGVTSVVRGADLLDSTPRQLVLYEHLGAPPPAYAHVPLWTDAGRKLSKRDADHSIRALPEFDAGPEAVIGLLAASVGLVEAGAAISARDLLARTTSEGWMVAVRG